MQRAERSMSKELVREQLGANEEWLEAYAKAGLPVQEQELLVKTMEFDFWAQRHDATMQNYLRAMLSEVTGEAKAFL